MAMRAHSVAVVAALAVVASAAATTPLSAWQADESSRIQVISANPFGLLLEFFNAEYERVVSPSSTLGFGGSTFSSDDDRYVNADVFWRYYPSGSPLDGWAFGAKLGMTAVDDTEYVGYGFDVNRSWVLGEQQNFYVGVGLGLKRLLGASDDDLGLTFIPTIRLVNIGIVF